MEINKKKTNCILPIALLAGIKDVVFVVYCMRLMLFFFFIFISSPADGQLILATCSINIITPVAGNMKIWLIECKLDSLSRLPLLRCAMLLRDE